MFASMFGGMAGNLFATLFPANCRFCSAPLLKVSRVPVCDSCLDDIRALDEPLCTICGERLFANTGADARCGMCHRIRPPFERAVAYGSYDGGLRELIQLLKYEQVRPAADVLGRMLAEVIRGLAAGFKDGPPLVVPVPLHPGKLRQRGFNQSELIARAAVKTSRLEGMATNTSALVRQRATESQTGLTRHQRRLNIRGAFLVTRPSDVASRDVLLVDDVYTTGTTVSECARVLLRAGASSVWVATVARVLRPELARACPQPDENGHSVQQLAAHA